MERTNLKVFRIRQHLSQMEMSKKVGITRSTYSAIELGKRNGKMAFWTNLQKAFDIPDDELWGLMQFDEAKENG